MPNSACRSDQQVHDLGLDGDIERRGRLVGDQQRGLAGERRRDHHALAHASGHAVRVVVVALGCRGNADAVEQADRACRARRASTGRDGARSGSATWAPIDSSGLSDDIGSWKIMAMSIAADRGHLALAEDARYRGPRSGWPRALLGPVPAGDA